MAAELDFRGMYEGLRGDRKRKRAAEEAEAAMEVDPRPAPVLPEAVPAGKKAKYNSEVGNLGRVSKRNWKAPKARMSSLSKTAVLKTSWDAKMRDKERRKLFLAKKTELKEEQARIKREARLRLEESKKRKEENSRRSAILQKVTNPKKLKKMSKKQLSKLRKIDT